MFVTRFSLFFFYIMGCVSEIRNDELEKTAEQLPIAFHVPCMGNLISTYRQLHEYNLQWFLFPQNVFYPHIVVLGFSVLTMA